MTCRANAKIAVSLATMGFALGAPALVRANSGGTSPTPTGGSQPSGQGQPQPTTGATAQPGDITVTASGGGITLATRASALLRRPLSFTGNAGRRAAGRIVEIERRGHQTDGRWAPTTHGTVQPDGSFTAVWPTNHIGQFNIRAVLLGPGAHAASASPAVTITVYRPSLATTYGPGFFGQKTACGETLTRGMLGVANKTLKCGTRVAIYYAGRTIVVPVIDRGPYAHGADWDLTSATARALHVPGTATVGAVSLPRG